MKYLLTALFIMACGVITPSWGQDQDTNTPEPEREGYGNALWGMSAAEVKALVKGAPEEVEGGFAVESTVAGHPAIVMYGFTQDKLTLVLVMFTDSHIESNHYISDWKELKDLLGQKYGVPVEIEWVWINDLFKDDPTQYGTAVSAEQLVIYETWKTEQTEIEHSLAGRNFQVIHKILYQSRQHQGLREEEQTKEHLDSL